MKLRLSLLLTILLFALSAHAADEVARLHALFDRTWESELKENPLFAHFGNDEYEYLARKLPEEQIQAHLQSDVEFSAQFIEHLPPSILPELLDVTPNGRARAARAARVMHGHMLWSGRTGAAPLTAFVRLGHTPELLRVIIGGQARRLRAIGSAHSPRRSTA